MMVAMNPQTWDADVAEIEPGGYLFYDSTRPLPPAKFRDDIHVIGMPLTEICNAVYRRPAAAAAVQEHRLRRRAVGAAGNGAPKSLKSCSASSTRARKSCWTPTCRPCTWAGTLPGST
jgi:hypothetical protein